MKSTILLTATAALTAALISPLQAEPTHGSGGRGSAPSVGRSSGAAQVRSAPAIHSAPAMRNGPQVRSNFTVPRNTSVQIRQPNRPAPTIAFGGSSQVYTARDRNLRNQNLQNQNAQNYQRTLDAQARSRAGYRSDYRSSRPPTNVYRNWDRRQVHAWNNHQYRWYGNDWVLYDSGFGYGYGTPYYYSDSGSYDSDTVPEPATQYDAGDTLASDVQKELSRRGYNPGGVDGVIGPQTRNAIAAFQNDRHLPVTGRIDQSLLQSLDLL